MNLELKRRWLTEKSTIGELYVDGLFECFTLEDRYRPPEEPKVYGETAIPNGHYRVVINHSPRFGIDMPLLLDVPGYQGVRIHPGNKPGDTEGCILLGKHRAIDTILESRLAYEALFDRLQKAQGPITITIAVLKADIC